MKLADYAIRSRHLPGRLLLAMLLLAIVLVLVAYQISNSGEVYPGVSVSGVHLGGMSPVAAMEAIVAALDPDAPVELFAGSRRFLLEPEEAVRFDARATAVKAYEVGRSGPRPLDWLELFASRLVGSEIVPVVVYDPDAAASAIGRIASEFDEVPQDASLSFDGSQVRLLAPREGRHIDQQATLSALARLAEDGIWPIAGVEMPVVVDRPAVVDSSAAAADAQALLSAPLILRAEDESWALHPDTLGGMLTTQVGEGRLTLDVDRRLFADWMTSVTDVVSTTAESPRFHFDPEAGSLRLIRPGKSGRRVNVPETANRILAEPAEHGHLVRVALDITPPAVRDGATAEELGIRELIREETSRFAGSPAERKHNIAQAASAFDGLLIAPEAVVSFNDIVGEIEEETGYLETKIIMDGATADGVGGGVCQVSTTLFRAAFWSGLPIVERLAHGYRVAYYEQGAPPGLDATVYGPVVDLKFENDTGAWLLLESETDEAGATVTFRIYGSAPDRQVDMEGPEIRAVVTPPPPETVIDPELSSGETEKLELARNGASVTITRVIRLSGEELREVFHSKYRPTGAITAIAPPPGWVPEAEETTEQSGSEPVSTDPSALPTAQVQPTSTTP